MKNTTQQLQTQLLTLVSNERKILATIIQHLQQISDKKLFLEFGRTSMLDYCVKDLGYSESAAYRRIKALKLARALPEVAKKIEDGNLTLTQAAAAQGLFEKYSQEHHKALPPETKNEMLKQIEGKGARESENMMRDQLKLPKKARRLYIEIEEETHKKWLEFKGRMINKNWSDEKLLNYLLDQATQPQRLIAAPTKSRPASKNQRYIQAHVWRELFTRATHCEYPGCQSTYGLEIDHIRPIRERGDSSPANLRILCKNHNLKRA